MQRMATALAATLLAVPTLLSAAEPVETNDQKEAISGREIFVREWIANDPRSHGGDGLGPVFNGSSCVTCHNLGGAGGAGGFDENVHLLSAAVAPQPTAPGVAGPGPGANEDVARRRKEAMQLLADQLHPDFAKGDTVVLHRFGTREGHNGWRNRMRSGQFAHNPVNVSNVIVPSFNPVQAPQVAQVEVFAQPVQVQHLAQPINGDIVFNLAQSGLAPNNSFPILNGITGQLNQMKSGARQGLASSFAFNNAVMRTSQRNTTALWGAGAVDRIPVAAIEALAKRQKEADGRVSGRVHRLADGRVGRFGWKAQKASLYDFTMAACATELGLNVPGEKQGDIPYDREYEAAGLDLTKREVDALVDYIAEFPEPGQLKPSHEAVATQLDGGEALFTSVGCAECHVKDVGEVKGLFTDLLLHDMGPDLGSVGSYGVPNIPEQDPDIPVANADDAKPKAIPPTSQEWRTPALWGLRDSAPYLHDGRAKTVEQAIAMHGGEAAEARLRYMLLKPAQRQQISAFLKTLVAPASVASAE